MEDVLLTGPQVAALCGRKPATIRSWRRRGLLEPVGLDEHGNPLYRQMDAARTEADVRKRASRILDRAA